MEAEQAIRMDFRITESIAMQAAAQRKRSEAKLPVEQADSIDV